MTTSTTNHRTAGSASGHFNVTQFFLDRHVEEGIGGRTALITEDRSFTYGELVQLTNRVGHVLRDLGVKKGDRVLLVLADGVQFVATWYAAIKVGAVTAEAYTFLPGKDLAHLINYSDARIVVVDNSTLPTVREAADRLPGRPRLLAVGVPRDHLHLHEESFDDLIAAAPAELDPADTKADDIAIWKFTTGSTGPPKAAVHRHSHPYASFRLYARNVLGLRETDVVLPVPKLFFGYARDLAALFPFGVGAAGIVFPQRTTPDLVFELIEKHRPSILVNVPTMMHQMVSHPNATRFDLSSLRLSTSAGEALPPSLHERWRQCFGVEVVDGIGSSEAYHIYISNAPGAVREGSVGRLVGGYSARLVDAAQRDVPDGQPGEMWITGPTVACGYWANEQKTRQAFEGNTYRSGDVLRRDRDGYFWFEGRVDAMLKVGGTWVAPAEIEECLRSHPAVAECVVVGFERDGLVVPQAWVVVPPGTATGVELAAELTDHVRRSIAPHKYPRDIQFVKELPKTPSGKIDRRALSTSPR